ncbi:peptide ABC transporter ATP-binding protein [Methanosarcina sp. 2.H.T.1A.6]|uniref:ABC transporter ATP-binding protein n=1 Tax=unclassified Methanosarcina TaxID=2644672 RepID=UPI0006225631|nr:MULTISPECIES: ABC transporter ATP-binding protein [unclassified Methanosarcina]KKG11114.1 peptide ABC transporter ATP-binding protein [Methanosarcina sp. 2.H.T.1A.15]KKG14035.1 peptide ABC transporter ATP-binding protein [Methanosarcina sp. 2.H.T.1A.3]KKG21419.1 peptide ABC transporter ATP-binding protein [Methanosarcina sp. 2.H.T.1A.6]KKG25267.1 peptide ABC transporter ATP-binding protein [Methanosarcina sp. 2.H.T.1A.8]
MLKAENLRCVYTSGLIKTVKKTAVCGVDLEICPGETVAIVGESGCGKSTLAKMLVQQLEPTSGEVFFDGTKLTGMNWKNLRKFMGKIQLIPQNPDDVVDPRWTVERSVAEPFVICGGFSREEISANVAALFEEVGLSAEHRPRYPHELSGGELQRVVIARALTLKPELLVCDEATSMLDVSVQAFIVTMLKEIQKKRGLGLVFITHDLEAAKAVSDRVLVMYAGEIVEEGKDVFDRPLHPYTRALMDAVQYASLEVVLPEDVGPLPDGFSGCSYYKLCRERTEACKESQKLRNVSERLVRCWKAK